MAPQQCATCTKAADAQCSRCKSVWYCSVDCQRTHWRQGHKKMCGTATTTTTTAPSVATSSKRRSNMPAVAPVSGGAMTPSASMITSMLGEWHTTTCRSDAERFEWLCNTYQLRCDDDVIWGGGDAHGPYDPDADAYSIMEDFLQFCLLAKRNGALPPGTFDWSAFLALAPRFVGFAMEKSDFNERWRSGSAALQSRVTAEQVYGRNVQAGSAFVSAAAKAAYERAQVDAGRGLSPHNAAVLNEVGGRDVWLRFRKAIEHYDDPERRPRAVATPPTGELGIVTGTGDVAKAMAAANKAAADDKQ